MGCWLSTKDGTIWAFIGPVVAIITVNTFVLIMVIKTVVSSASAVKSSDRAHLKAYWFSCCTVFLTVRSAKLFAGRERNIPSQRKICLNIMHPSHSRRNLEARKRRTPTVLVSSKGDFLSNARAQPELFKSSLLTTIMTSPTVRSK